MMKPFPPFPKRMPNVVRTHPQKQKFHRLLKEAYQALENDLVQKETPGRSLFQDGAPGSLHSNSRNPANVSWGDNQLQGASNNSVWPRAPLIH